MIDQHLPEARRRFVQQDAGSLDLKHRVKLHERAIQIALFACGFLSILTTLGIILVLGNESISFFTRDQWVNTNRSILSDMDERTTVFTVEPGKALEDVAQSGTIRVGQEVMSIVEFQHNAIGIDVVGTGGGFGSWCAPDAALADLGARRPKIVNASREIKPEELERCSAFGITPIEFRVGTDALAITVSADNTFVDELSIAELRQIFGGAETWTQVRPEWPDVPIQLVIPGEYSGTYDFFIDAVFDGDVSALRAQGAITSENDNQLVGSISRNRFSIGFFGYAYYLANSDDLRIVPLDGIRPSAETVEDGSYSLARPLFIYSDAGIMRDHSANR